MKKTIKKVTEEEVKVKPEEVTNLCVSCTGTGRGIPHGLLPTSCNTCLGTGLNK